MHMCQCVVEKAFLFTCPKPQPNALKDLSFTYSHALLLLLKFKYTCQKTHRPQDKSKHEGYYPLKIKMGFGNPTPRTPDQVMGAEYGI